MLPLRDSRAEEGEDVREERGEQVQKQAGDCAASEFASQNRRRLVASEAIAPNEKLFARWRYLALHLPFRRSPCRLVVSSYRASVKSPV